MGDAAAAAAAVVVQDVCPPAVSSKSPINTKKYKSVNQKGKERPPPPDGSCKLYLPMKGRYCKFALKTLDDDYCPLHMPKEDRVPCPLDPTHSVLKSNLERHLSLCPSLREKALLEHTPFYSKHC